MAGRHTRRTRIPGILLPNAPFSGPYLCHVLVRFRARPKSISLKIYSLPAIFEPGRTILVSMDDYRHKFTKAVSGGLAQQSMDSIWSTVVVLRFVGFKRK